MTNHHEGILFTNKEWQIANDFGEDYYVCLVKNVETKPEIRLINNPAKRYNPNHNINSIIQVSWIVSEKELNH